MKRPHTQRRLIYLIALLFSLSLGLRVVPTLALQLEALLDSAFPDGNNSTYNFPEYWGFNYTDSGAVPIPKQSSMFRVPGIAYWRWVDEQNGKLNNKNFRAKLLAEVQRGAKEGHDVLYILNGWNGAVPPPPATAPSVYFARQQDVINLAAQSSTVSSLQAWALEEARNAATVIDQVNQQRSQSGLPNVRLAFQLGNEVVNPIFSEALRTYYQMPQLTTEADKEADDVVADAYVRFYLDPVAAVLRANMPNSTLVLGSVNPIRNAATRLWLARLLDMTVPSSGQSVRNTVDVISIHYAGAPNAYADIVVNFDEIMGYAQGKPVWESEEGGKFIMDKARAPEFLVQIFPRILNYVIENGWSPDRLKVMLWGGWIGSSQGIRGNDVLTSLFQAVGTGAIVRTNITVTTVPPNDQRLDVSAYWANQNRLVLFVTSRLGSPPQPITSLDLQTPFIGRWKVANTIGRVYIRGRNYPVTTGAWPQDVTDGHLHLTFSTPLDLTGSGGVVLSVLQK